MELQALGNGLNTPQLRFAALSNNRNKYRKRQVVAGGASGRQNPPLTWQDQFKKTLTGLGAKAATALANFKTHVTAQVGQPPKKYQGATSSHAFFEVAVKALPLYVASSAPPKDAKNEGARVIEKVVRKISAPAYGGKQTFDAILAQWELAVRQAQEKTT